MTCLPALLATVVVIAASLLGGCSDSLIGAGGDVAPVPASAGDLAAARAATSAAKGPIGVRLASAALDDGRLSQIRGGFETSSGVVLNFAFQQATFINHSLAENIVVPTITVAPGAGTPVGSAAVLGAVIPSVGGLGTSAPNPGSTAILGNGIVQTQVSPSAPIIQALVNSGMTSVVSTLGSGGLNNVVTNGANNQLVQQVTTLDIGVTGLTKLIQQGIPSAAMNRLLGGAQFR